jgi:hypothetical protein
MYHDVTPPKRNAEPATGPAVTSAATGAEAGEPVDEVRGEPDARESAADRGEKKERVLHTRVPAVLEEELKRFAQNLRVPVSNLVRTILEDALQVADAASETVESRLKNAARQLEEERKKLKQRVAPTPLSDVFAFQTLTLAQPARCAQCQKPLGPGERAHMGLTDGPPKPGASRVFVCEDCLPR